MTKVALITDTHYGARGDNPALYNHFNDFMKNDFFPILDKHKIRHVIHLGDLVDKRKQISFKTANELRKNFINPCMNRGIHLDILVGNHDIPFKNTNDVNAIEELYGNYQYIKIYKNPVEMVVGGNPCVFLPWINKENITDTLTILNQSPARYVFGHLELVGFQMHKGNVCTHGMESNLFKKFDTVFTGHFHHKSSVGNIEYLGAPYEMIWSDYNDPRGFHILDLDSGKLEFIQNKNSIFHKLYFDGTNADASLLLDTDYSYLQEKYVRLIVNNTENAIILDSLIQKIQEVNPIDLQIIDESIDFVVDKNVELTEEEQDDTKTVISACVDSIDTKIDKEKIKNKLIELYNIASKVEI